LLEAPVGVFQRPGMGDAAVAELKDGDLIEVVRDDVES
jgi:putative ubiquitin-RnfH superfamily antitoxin RatB of RatAB toxin-antitoxin module